MFRMANHHKESKLIDLNVCNLKRNLTMFSDGAKIYTRKINNLKHHKGEWRQNDGYHLMKVNNNAKFTSVRLYKLSFSVTVEA